MNRRAFVTGLGAVLAVPLRTGAQPAGKQQRGTPHVGVLVAESAPHPFTEAFRSGMRELGYVEGRTVAIEWRYADALFARAVELATELVRLKVDVIAAHHTPAVKAAMSVTSTIPIVMSPAGAPLQVGLVKSFAKPGGNVTGLSSMEAELGSKRLELLVDIIPAFGASPFSVPRLTRSRNHTCRISRTPQAVSDFNCSLCWSTARASSITLLRK